MVGDPDFQAQVDALARSKVKLYWTGAGDDDIARLRTFALYEYVKAKACRPPTSRSRALTPGPCGETS